jgi:hypothetical protein
MLLFIFTHGNTHVFTHVCTFLHTWLNMFTHMFTNVHTHLYSHVITKQHLMFTNMLTNMFTHIFTKVFTHMLTQMCTQSEATKPPLEELEFRAGSGWKFSLDIIWIKETWLSLYEWPGRTPCSRGSGKLSSKFNHCVCLMN